MADFKLEIGTGIKTIDVTDSTGKVIATKTVNVGNKAELRKWIEEFKALETVKPTGDGLDEAEMVCKKVIDATIGDWDLFWKASGENPLVLIRTLSVLLGWLKAELDALYQGMI
jgi:hypothetical protein